MRTDVTSRVVRLLAAGAIVAAGLSTFACGAPGRLSTSMRPASAAWS